MEQHFYDTLYEIEKKEDENWSNRFKPKALWLDKSRDGDLWMVKDTVIYAMLESVLIKSMKDSSLSRVLPRSALDKEYKFLGIAQEGD